MIWLINKDQLSSIHNRGLPQCGHCHWFCHCTRWGLGKWHHCCKIHMMSLTGAPSRAIFSANPGWKACLIKWFQNKVVCVHGHQDPGQSGCVCNSGWTSDPGDHSPFDYITGVYYQCNTRTFKKDDAEQEQEMKLLKVMVRIYGCHILWQCLGWAQTWRLCIIQISNVSLENAWRGLLVCFFTFLKQEYFSNIPDANVSQWLNDDCCKGNISCKWKAIPITGSLFPVKLWHWTYGLLGRDSNSELRFAFPKCCPNLLEPPHPIDL